MIEDKADSQMEEQTQLFTVIGPGATIAHYRILSKIGAGGMGEVYLAEDGKLNRKIALKFLPPHFANDEAFKARFLREARSAAALNHPNIITIYEISEHQGRLFIAMEYLEGRSLAELIKEGRVEFSRAVEITTQLCRGLDKAHQHQIVHRDIKSENVLLDSDGHVKILDFGLAKTNEDDQLTRAGTAMGTANYMSPEQGQGLEVDHRSDIFSTGVLLYQMVTGELPFKRNNLAATIYAVVNDTPKQLSDYGTEQAVELQAVLDRALAKEAKDRYQDIATLAADLKALQSGGEVSQLSVAAAVPAQPQVKSLAVLYLRNLGSADDEFLSYGITEDLIIDLSRVGSIRVASMRSIAKFKDSDDELEEIAAKLNVKVILDGSIHKSPTSLRVSVQLVEVESGATLWAERWQESPDSLPQIKQALADGISRALEIDTSPAATAQVDVAATRNPQAYEYYLRGKYAFNRRQDAADIEVALGLYRQAIELEPSLLAARAGVAEILIHRGDYVRAQEEVDGALTSARQQNLRGEEAALLVLKAKTCVGQSAWDEAISFGNQALQLVQKSGDVVVEGDALAILIAVLQRRADFNKALSFFERVLEINRKLDDQQKTAEALKNMGTVHLRMGDYEKARALYGEAGEIAKRRHSTSLQADCMGNIGLTYFHTGKPAEALRHYQQALRIHAQLGDRQKEALWLNNIGQVHESRGDYRLALESFEQVSTIDRERGDRGKYALSHGNSAAMLAVVGEYERALDYVQSSLEIAAEVGYPLVQASGFDTLGTIKFHLGETEAASENYQAALRVAVDNGLRLNVAFALTHLGELEYAAGSFAACREQMTAALALAEEIDQQEVQIKVGAYLGAISVLDGNFEKGITELREAIIRAEQLGDPRYVLTSRRLLGQALFNSADAADRNEGQRLLESALALASEKEIAAERRLIEEALQR